MPQDLRGNGQIELVAAVFAVIIGAMFAALFAYLLLVPD